MKNEHSALQTVIDLAKWQQLQDSLALATKMSLITIDYKGTPVTEHSSCCDFCRQARQDPRLLPLCKKCDSRGGLEAVRDNKPYIYYCHFGIIDVAIPIIVDDKYIGAVMAGQVKLPSEDASCNDLEQLLALPNSEPVRSKLEQLRQDYDKIPVLPFDQIRMVSDMLYHLCNYIVEEALEKQLKIETYMTMLHGGPSLLKSDEINGYGIENIKRVKKEVSNTLIDVFVSEASAHKYPLSTPLLQPAFDYIQQHKSENPTLKQVSEACHISPSYFSRIFLKETGENFTNYISRLKVAWAKELLETTDMSVSQISDALGFSDSGYLIKRFKSMIGVTPAVYRRNLSLQRRS